MADDFERSLDTLESAFSDSSRQGIRRIKTEWLKVLKYKNDLLAKENEVASVKEKITHLKELKCQNEKYLHMAQSKLQNLKQSDIQLKGKLSDLRKEETRLTEKCRTEEEYMQKKLSFYEEKWRKRHETGLNDSKNSQIREKQRAIFEMEELKRKLISLEKNFHKSERDLFQAKCERNKRTDEENETSSFKNFVVKVAKMYVETKKMFVECEKTSEEIKAIEKNIEMKRKMKRQGNSIARRSALENDPNNLHDVGGPSSSRVESKKIEDINRVERNFGNNSNTMNQMETCDDNPTVPIDKAVVQFANDNDCINGVKTSNARLNVESKHGSTNNVRYFQNNKSVNDSQNINHSAEIFAGSRRTSDEGRTENFTSKFGKTQPKESKVRKWMERLSIYVPSFGSDEKAEHEDLRQQKRSENTEPENLNKKKTTLDDQTHRETFMSSNNSVRPQKYDSFVKDSSFALDAQESLVKPSDQNMFSSPVKIQKSVMNIDAKIHDSLRKDSSLAPNAYASMVKPNDKNNFSSPVKIQKSSMNIDAKIETQKYDSYLKDFTFAPNTFASTVKQDGKNKIPSPVKIQKSNMNIDAKLQTQKYDSFGKDSAFAPNAHANMAKSNDENKFSSSVKIQTSNMNTVEHSSEQNQSTSKNTSKYFGENESTSAMDWDDVQPSNKSEDVKAVPNEIKKQSVEARVLTVRNDTINNDDTLKEKNMVKIQASVEAKEESKGFGFYSKIQQQTSRILPNIPEEKQVEEVNIMVVQENKTEDIDTEMVGITENNNMPDRSSEMEVTDDKLDYLKDNLQTLSTHAEKQKAKEVISKQTTEVVAELPAAQPTVDPPSEQQLFQELNPHRDQVMTYEQRGENEREAFVEKKDKHSQELDQAPNIYQKDPTGNFLIPSPYSAAPTPPSTEAPVGNIEMNPQNPMVAVTQASAIPTQDMLTASDFPAYKSDNSPGFEYKTRLMFEALASQNDKMAYKGLPKDILAQLAYFNNSPSNMSFPKSSPEEDGNEAFLASAYEDYLEDSPPALKAKERSMFQFADDSPEKGVKDDFFPLFGENNNGESSKDSKASGGQFTFNFGGNDEKSPEENTSGFQFLF